MDFGLSHIDLEIQSFSIYRPPGPLNQPAKRFTLNWDKVQLLMGTQYVMFLLTLFPGFYVSMEKIYLHYLPWRVWFEQPWHNKSPFQSEIKNLRNVWYDPINWDGRKINLLTKYSLDVSRMFSNTEIRPSHITITLRPKDYLPLKLRYILKIIFVEFERYKILTIHLKFYLGLKIKLLFNQNKIKN